VKDAALIAAAQDAEHIEIASYGTLRTWAATLKQLEAVHALEWTLEEEKAVDKRLTEIAETLNFRAAAAQAH
jgi:ferritin-like metal-binding protein YciE